MTLLRSSSYGGQAHLRSFAAPTRQGRLRSFAATAIAVLAGGSATVLACPACFGAEETTMLEGTQAGVAVLLSITFAVQGAFLGFFLYLRRRAKRMAELELDSEWSELQRSRT